MGKENVKRGAYTILTRKGSQGVGNKEENTTCAVTSLQIDCAYKTTRRDHGSRWIELSTTKLQDFVMWSFDGLQTPLACLWMRLEAQWYRSQQQYFESFEGIGSPQVLSND